MLLNPVRAGTCARPQQWQWSSRRPTLALDPPPELLHQDRTRALIGGDDQFAPRLRAFLEGRVDDDNPFSDLGGRILLGSDRFLEQHTATLKPVDEVPRAPRQPTRPELPQLFSQSGDRALAIAYHHYDHTMLAIAQHLHV